MLKRRTVDVIVPVHDAYAELHASLQSLSRHGGDYRLILIDDGSADERIGALFRELSASSTPHILLLRNERKLGFHAAANRGMARGGNDVVLLHSGTLVTEGWLDKLTRCATSDARIGTITPFSNSAGAGFFDVSFGHDAAPADPELVSRAMELSAVPLYPDIPAMGQDCVFIRRRLLRKMGARDSAFGAAAGEEVDFSMRARKAGYRNVLCDDTFVFRPGIDSCGYRERTPEQQIPVHVRASHPDHLELMPEFIGKDAIEPIRGMIRSQVALLSRAGIPGVLHVLHGRGGGTEKYVRDLIAATRDDFRHYFLRILHDRWRLTDANGATPTHYEHLRHREDAAGAWLAPLCSWLRIDLVHVHSLVGSGDDLLKILEATGLPYCYSVHDMYLACPTVYLIDSRGNYCDATTDNAVCSRCLSGFPALQDTDIERWRRRYGAFLERASEVFAPSEWARDTLKKYFPRSRVTVAPLGLGTQGSASEYGVSDRWQLPNDEHRHVGVLGAIGPEKGSRHLERLEARIRERNLPLRLVLVGYTDRTNRHQSTDRVLTVHGPYQSGEIEALLDWYRIAIVIFPTVWPETFSYTLSETWVAGRPVLVPPAGALQERVLATGAGWIMDGWPNPDAILDQLMALTAPGNRGELGRRAQIAKSVFRDGQDVTEALKKSYRDMLADATGKIGHVVSRLQIHETACRALGAEPLGPADPAAPGPVRGGTKVKRLFRLLRG